MNTRLALFCGFSDHDDAPALSSLSSLQARQDVQDIAGKTPLHVAAGEGRIEMLKILLETMEEGTDDKIQDSLGRTALAYAQEKKQHQCVEFLQGLQHCKPLPAVSTEQAEELTPYECCLRHMADHDRLRGILAQDNVQRWVRVGGLDREGVDCQIVGVVPKSLAHIAAKGGYVDSLRVLLDANASPNVIATGLPGHISGETPLHLALSNHHEGCVRLLLEYKV